MQYQVIATMPTTGEVIIIETADSLPHAEEIARRFKLTLKTDWLVTIVELTNVVPIIRAELPDPDPFAEVTARNKAKEDKLKQERATANKRVMRTYRIKH